MTYHDNNVHVTDSPTGLAFPISDLLLLRGWADRYDIIMTIELDHRVRWRGLRGTHRIPHRRQFLQLSADLARCRGDLRSAIGWPQTPLHVGQPSPRKACLRTTCWRDGRNLTCWTRDRLAASATPDQHTPRLLNERSLSHARDSSTQSSSSSSTRSRGGRRTPTRLCVLQISSASAHNAHVKPARAGLFGPRIATRSIAHGEGLSTQRAHTHASPL